MIIYIATLVTFIIGMSSADTYPEYLHKNGLAINPQPPDFCQVSPQEDEEIFYCGFYSKLDSALWNSGQVYSQVVNIDNLNKLEKNKANINKVTLNVIIDLEVSNDLVYISPQVVNISSGDNLAMRYFAQGNCRDEKD